MNAPPSLQDRFSHWLEHNRGRLIAAEDFRTECPTDEPSIGWQRAMSSLITCARRDGQIEAAAIVRDHYGSYKTQWRVAA